MKEHWNPGNLRVKILVNVEPGDINAPTDELTERGYAMVEQLENNNDAEYCWHLCNWACWSGDEVQPENLFSDVDVCNHGIVFVNPETNVWFLALSNGWLHGTEAEVREYIRTHHDKTFWDAREK